MEPTQPGSTLMEKKIPLVGKTPVTRVKLGDVSVLSLLDSGSQVSLLEESVYWRDFKPRGYPLQSLEGLTLRAVNGGHVPYIGFIVVDVDVV